MQALLARIDEHLQFWMRWLAYRPGFAVTVLVLLCLALYLPGSSSLPVTDRDEARFAQATKQMLESGDFVDIRFQEQPRYKKPVGIYWLQAAAVSLISPDDLTQISAYRLPSLLGVILAVVLTWWAARPIFGKQTALLAALLLAGAFTLSLEARIAKSDGALFAAIVLMQGALARLYLFRHEKRDMRGIAAIFWTAAGLGILIKGPIAPALAILTILPLVIFDKERRWLRNLHAVWGLPLMLAITLPWFIAIGIVSDWAFFKLAFGDDFLAKIQSGQEKHWGPPGFYFILFWWSFWPAALVATGGAAIWLWRHRPSRRALFLLAWIIPFWLVLEATPTKLPHYSMVVYPGIAIAAAWALREATLLGGIPMRTYKQGAAIWLFVWALQVAFLIFLHGYFWIAPSIWLVPVLAAAGGIAFLTLRAAWYGRFHAAIAFALISAVLVYSAAFRLVLPEINPIWMSRQADTLMSSLRPCLSGPVALTSYREPSAVFLLGTDTRMMQSEEANLALSEGRLDLALINRADAAKLPLVDPAPRPIACVEGFNVNGGDHLMLQAITARPEESLRACAIPERFRCR